jgi:Xaa-Pro aminopeptidase
MIIKDRIADLRRLMQANKYEAYIINGTDPHLSEYLPARWKTREWISGFTGSYGRVVVTNNKSLLWTDSRYFIQAEEELKNTGITLMKDRLPDSVLFDDWLCSELDNGSVVGVDGQSLSTTEALSLESKLNANGIGLETTRDLLAEIWKKRPLQPDLPAYEHTYEYARQTRTEKLKNIRKELYDLKVESTIIPALDDLAWTFNIRGNDIAYNPVVTGYGYIDQTKAYLFIDNKKLPEELRESLENDGIDIREYDSFISFLENIECKSVFFDANSTNIKLFNAIPKKCHKVNGLSISCLFKSIKNSSQIDMMQKAHQRDGAAVINFIYWLENNIDRDKITELTVCNKLKEFRSQQPHFIGESFHTIAGYAEHGAMPHYSITEESDKEILSENFLLIDSGGQYLDGTTDITRTIAMGSLTDQQKTDFTLVLKGTIQLSLAKFPEGTKGANIDMLARKALWDSGINYGHGTGHGVGYFLGVHEGPVSIRQEFNNEPIRVGQVTSNEPGLYREGKYGIRIENMIVCREDRETEFGKFLKFDTLTLCPIDLRSINKALMTKEEIEWLNSYHNRVYKEVGPLLSSDIREWLKDKCREIY